MEGFAVMPSLDAASAVTCSSPSRAAGRAAGRALHAHEGRRRARQRRALRRGDLAARPARGRGRACATCCRSCASTTSAGDALNLLAGGRVVNLAAADGHPAAVMDVSFALQALAAEALATESFTPGVHPVPDADRARGRGAEAGGAGRRDRRADARAGRLPARSHRHRATADADLGALAVDRDGEQARAAHVDALVDRDRAGAVTAPSSRR